jgi:HEAT repeat protein
MDGLERRTMGVWVWAWSLLLLAGCAGPGSPRWERRVMSSLQEGGTQERREVLRDLKGPGTPAVCAELTAILATEADPVSRALAAGALGRMCGASCAAELARSALQDSSSVVRLRALAALADVAPQDLAAAAPQALQRDPEPAVRVLAVELIAKALPPDRAAQIIVDGLQDNSEAVAVTAHACLTRLTGRKLPPTDVPGWRQAVGTAPETPPAGAAKPEPAKP